MTGTRIPRRFAVLRNRYEHIQLIDLLTAAIQTSDHHELVAPAGCQLPVRPVDWRLFADDDQIDAVIVCGHDPETLEAARQLTIRGVPLIIEAKPSLPAEFVAEMALYDAEGSSTLRPWFDSRWHFAEENRIARGAPLGNWQTLQIERGFQADDTPDYKTVDRTLQVDIDWLRLLGGDYSQVTCIRSGTDEDWTIQTLQLSGPGLPDASCVYRRQGTQHGPVLRIDGAQDYLEAKEEDEDVVITVGGKEVHRRRRFTRSAQQKRMQQQLDELWQDTPDSARWRDLVRNFEIQEAMQRSLRRRRTIDLQFETTSERSQFKTYMATIGCGVVLWTMLGIIALLLAGAVLDPRDRMQRQAEAAGFVLRTDEFEAGAAMLTPAGREHLQQISTGIGLGDAVVYIEASATAGDPDPLDDQRRDEVWSQLSQAGAEDASRVVVRPLRGQWFLRGMQLARVLVFAPVALFLLFQLLLLITRPAAPQKTHSP
jgi:hypothetical protein